MKSPIFRARRVVGTVTVVALAIFGLVLAQPLAASADPLLPGPAPVEQRSASTVTSDPLPTVQIDSGVVWVQQIIGNTVYAGGSFSNARPAGATGGTNLMPRANILAYNIDSGVATSFAPVINGTVKSMAASPDGTRLYVGGQFTTVNGTSRFNFAAFDTATGALLNTFKPAVGGSYVNAIVATSSAVYVGGLIGAGAGVTRKNFAAFSASNGALLAWAPTSDLQVDAMVMSPTSDKIIVGGRFGQVNGASQRGLAALDLTSGALLPWDAPQTVVNGMSTGTYKGKAGIYSLAVDSNSVYGTGWVYANVATGNLEGTFSAQGGSGAINWIADCHGDHYGVYSDGTNVYTTSHQHACESMGGAPQSDPSVTNLRHAAAYTAAAKGTLTRSPQVSDIYADWSGYPAPAAIDWYPDWVTGKATGDGQAGWDMTGNGKYLLVGGEFPYVNGKLQQGIVRFSTQPAGGPKTGPRWSGANWVPTTKSNTAGTVRISIPSNWDRDDLTLTYKLYRTGTTAPIQTQTGQSTFWSTPTQSFSDSGRTPGSTQTYKVTATDPDGNVVNSNTVSAVVSSQPASDYANAVLDDGASLYWRLGTSGAGTETDWAGSNDGTIAANVTASSTGAVNGDVSTASTFTGSQTSSVYSTAQIPVPASYSLEFWLSTTTTNGGKIVGYGNQQTGNSSSYDRHVYMANSGRLVYGNYDGNTRTIETPNAYNDGAWHHVVGTQGPGGMALYVDGKLIGKDTTAPTAQNYTGYWRVGGDNIGGWPDGPSSYEFSGQVDEFAVYGSVISGAQAAEHYALGAGQTPPVAAFTSCAADQTIAFDGSGSTVPAGQTISSYSWDFGDGSTGVGVSPSHSYGLPGTYAVALTVTSSIGLTSQVTTSVVAQAPHQAPTAAIAAVAAPVPNTLTGKFDGTGSSALDGATIAGYWWNFGDGSTSTLAQPTHAYASASTWPVTLTVTDSLGLTSPVATADFTSTHNAPSASFASSTNLLSVAVDASASTATDGQALAFRWIWGDGTPDGSGVTSTHSYGVAGTYTLTLEVSDGLGAVTTASSLVTLVAQAPIVYVASDDFGRTVASGWGTANIGGVWSTGSGLSVANGFGVLTAAASSTRTTVLNSVSAKDSDGTVLFSNSVVANGGGTHFNYLVRKTTAGDYRLKVRVGATGVVTVNIGKYVGTTETLFAGTNLAGFTYTPGKQLSVRLVVTTVGSSTQLQAKVWPASSAEPSAWTTTASDSQAALQVAGGVGISTYVAGSVTNGPVATNVTGLRVK